MSRQSEAELLAAEDASKRRAAARVKYACFAWIDQGPTSRVQGIARTIDLSSKGVGLLLAGDFEIGQRVVVELLLPASMRLRANGEVVHSSRAERGQYRVGVRFDSAPALVDPEL